jgi:hypothetical protein
MTLRDDTSGSPRTGRGRAPKSVPEIVDRLRALESRKGTPGPAAVVAAFPKRGRILTTPDERQHLADLLATLDPSWLARASITVRGVPEGLTESSSTLGSVLAGRARAESAYPADRDLARWAESLDATGPKARHSPWLYLVAVWPDRDSDGAPLVITSTLVSAAIGATATDPRVIDELCTWLADPRRGRVRSAALQRLIAPLALQVNDCREKLASHDETLRLYSTRAAALQDDVTRLDAYVGSLTAQLADARAQASLAESKASAAEERRRRHVQQTEGVAAQQRFRIVRDYSRGIRDITGDAIDYLDRDRPNVDGALRKLRELSLVAESLEGEA